MKMKAHSNPNSKSWLITLVVMLVLSVVVVFSSVFVTKSIKEKNNQPIDLDLKISSTVSLPVEENELNVTAVQKAVDSSGNVVAYVISGTTVGYNQESPIEMSTTITADATVVTGIEIENQAETEYLGVRIQTDEFQNQFKGRKLPVKPSSSIVKGSDVDVIANSTVSSQAVIDGVNNAQEYVQQFLAE